MKKIFMLLFIFAFSMPAFATCPIDGGACTASIWDSKPLQQRYIPNRLDDIKATDAFKPTYVTPYKDMLINTESTKQFPTNNYDSNCQFGVCLPSKAPLGDIVE